MAKYNLNEVLKERERQQAGKQSEETEVKLDDVSRVKVLSPGRQVAKRFVRNRLAVFGTISLAVLFLFSFVGPLFYKYGQKQIFYKYDAQNVNYALAKVNTAYNGYDVDSSVELDSTVVNAMNSSIKSMIAAGEKMRMVEENGVFYVIEEVGEEVYTLSSAEATEVCTAGNTKEYIGNYDAISKEITFEGDEVEGLSEAASKSITVKSSNGEFEAAGVAYSFEKGAGKSFDIYLANDGVKYVGAELGDSFESALTAASEAKAATFEEGGKVYSVLYAKDNCTVYEAKAGQVGKVYTRYTVDTYETGLSVSDEFKAQALVNAYTTGAFTVDGSEYKVTATDNSELIITDAEGKEFAEFTGYSVRRYSGEDSMEYDLKKAVIAKLDELSKAGVREGVISYNLPMQDPETGVYSYDEDGNLMYNETEILMTQRNEGEFVLSCDQIIYKIDMYAAPSATHILGTDGDGFDVMARIMYGGRISLMVGFVVIILEMILGVIMGGLAGFYGRWVDNLIMRLVDIFYCLPSMPIMIILGAMMDAMRMNTYVRLIIMMAALGIMGWAGVARLVRGQILSLREQEFMLAAESTGIKVKDRIFKHLIPNVMPQLIVNATMGIGGVIITESTLSFLGLGVKHPLATWGTIINSVSSASAMQHYTFIWIPVGLLICFTVISFNFVGDGLRDAYDPRAKR